MMQKWQYLYVHLYARDLIGDYYRINGVMVSYPGGRIWELINICGDQGWELVSAQDGVYIFKRPESK